MAELSRAKSALGDAAERLDRLARGVKDQQLAETRTGPRIALTESYTSSPEEAWAKKFMTQAIGPAVTTLTAPALPAFLPLAQPPLVGPGFTAVPAAKVQKKSAMPHAAPEVRPGTAKQEAIGGAIGKPPRRRSWVGRLFLGK